MTRGHGIKGRKNDSLRVWTSFRVEAVISQSRFNKVIIDKSVLFEYFCLPLSPYANEVGLQRSKRVFTRGVLNAVVT